MGLMKYSILLRYADLIILILICFVRSKVKGENFVQIILFYKNVYETLVLMCIQTIYRPVALKCGIFLHAVELHIFFFFSFVRELHILIMIPAEMTLTCMLVTIV